MKHCVTDKNLSAQNWYGPPQTCRHYARFPIARINYVTPTRYICRNPVEYILSKPFIITADFQNQIHNWKLEQEKIGHAQGHKLKADWNFSNPRMGMIWKLNDSLNVFINWGKAQKEPADNQIIQAVHSLGCNLGAIEFFVVNNSLYFLELNPIWHGHASREGFGSKEFQNYIMLNKKSLIKKIPNIYNWLDYPEFYRTMYMNISNLKDA